MVPSRRMSQNWLPDFFNDFFDTDWMVKTNATAPAINVLENENGYELELAAPGMKKEDFTVIADYNEIKRNPSSEKCHIYLKTVPSGISRTRLETSSVDYLIESAPE